MRTYGSVAALLALSLLAGCGKSDDASKKQAATAGDGAVQTADAAAPGDSLPSCPAQTSPVSGPDIVGIHLGIPRAEALAIAQCHNQSAKVKFEDDWMRLTTHGIKLNPQLFRVTSGVPKVCRDTDIDCRFGGKIWDKIDEEITVAAPGVPGHETVAGVWRTQNFAEGKQPAVNDLIAALTKKYGQPQFRQEAGRPAYIDIVWIADPSGAPISEQNPNYNNCRSGVAPDGEWDQRWSGGCGMSISARIDRSPNNPDLAADLKVGMMDQDKTYNYGDAIQRQLDDMDAARRKQELEKAHQAGGDVQL